MLFNSIQYLFFLPIVVAGYFMIPHRMRWLWLLVASYTFYMSWQPLYALLLLGSTSLDYGVARAMESRPTKKSRKPLLYLSILGNLGTLLVFKYLGFFNELVRDLASFADLEYTVSPIQLLLPIGISFYTFQSLSYTIDVYRGDRPPEKHFGYLALYVSFFPQLIAGPIERSKVLLPQLHIKQHFSWFNLSEGLQLIAWGLFKKIALADRLGHYVNIVYANPDDYHGFTYVMVGAAFSLQVLFDFGAYTDIAVGSAKIFGIDLSINFRQPFRATSMKEFWRRWHMSLTQWFFEYLYKPLGRKLRMGWQLNIFIFMLVIGFWHGPSWGFLIFGVLHGIYYIVSDYMPIFESKKSKALDIFLKGLAMFGIFVLGSISTYFFRADTVADAFYALSEAGSSLASFNFNATELGLKTTDLIIITLNLGVYIFVQNLPNHNPKNPLAALKITWMRWAALYFIIFMIISLAHTKMQEFLYFHF